MEVKSKFNKGQTIYFMNGEMPAKDVVSGITFFVGKKEDSVGTRHETMGDIPDISYHLENDTKSVHESAAYETKEYLIEATFKNL